VASSPWLVHAMLGRICVVKAMREDEGLTRLREKGPSASVSAARAMEENEAALKLDATLPDRFFADPANRAMCLHVGFHSVYLGLPLLLHQEDQRAGSLYRIF